MPEEKDGLIAKLQEVEDWLYEDGEDETKGVYIAKLEELKNVLPFFATLLLPSALFLHIFLVLNYLTSSPNAGW
jgi:hypothetical protein